MINKSLLKRGAISIVKIKGSKFVLTFIIVVIVEIKARTSVVLEQTIKILFKVSLYTT